MIANMNAGTYAGTYICKYVNVFMHQYCSHCTGCYMATTMSRPPTFVGLFAKEPYRNRALCGKDQMEAYSS